MSDYVEVQAHERNGKPVKEHVRRKDGAEMTEQDWEAYYAEQGASVYESTTLSPEEEAERAASEREVDEVVEAVGLSELQPETDDPSEVRAAVDAWLEKNGSGLPNKDAGLNDETFDRFLDEVGLDRICSDLGYEDDGRPYAVVQAGSHIGVYVEMDEDASSMGDLYNAFDAAVRENDSVDMWREMSGQEATTAPQLDALKKARLVSSWKARQDVDAGQTTQEEAEDFISQYDLDHGNSEAFVQDDEVYLSVEAPNNSTMGLAVPVGSTNREIEDAFLEHADDFDANAEFEEIWSDRFGEHNGFSAEQFMNILQEDEEYFKETAARIRDKRED